MKVAHIGFLYGLNNTGGAAISSTRLHLALLEAGVDSYYICVQKREDGPNVYVLPSSGIFRCIYFVLTKFTRCIWKFTQYRKSICLNIVPMFGLERLLAAIKPDVVHVQWINADVCSFEQLSKLPYRLVFNMHDLYMINALEVHPGGDTRFKDGFTKSNSGYIEQWLFSRKRRLVNRCRSQGLSFLAPSDWAASMCRESLIGKGAPVYTVSNLVDYSIKFHRKWRRPHEQFTILFCAFGGRRNAFKGWDELETAIRVWGKRLANKSSVRIDVCGEASEDTDISGVKVHFLGTMTDSMALCHVYHEADILAFPSRLETQGVAKVEALLCGLPVVAFRRSACPEGIVQGVTGLVVEDGDIDGFADSLSYYYNLFLKGDLGACHEKIANLAESMFSRDVLIERIISCYRNVDHIA